ncbi:hypothetical protein V2W45_1329197 [Cenococcum geophilum]
MSRRQLSSITSNQAGRESTTSRQIVRLPSNAMSLFPPYSFPIQDTAGARSPFQSQFNQLYHRGIAGQPHSSNPTASRLPVTHGVNHDEIIAIVCIVLLTLSMLASMGWSLHKRRRKERSMASQNNNRKLDIER